MSEAQTRKKQGPTYLIRKYLISAFVIASFAAYVIHENGGGPSAQAAVAPVQAPKPTEQTSAVATVGAPTPTDSPSATPVPADTAQSATSTNAPTPAPTAVPPTSAPPSPTDAPTAAPTAVASGYKNGQFTGQEVDAFYGIVQVQVNIQGGKIANVQFLQYPNDRSRSVYINSQAMPMLQQEAIQAQSAQVDIIGGATLTSQAFVMSLQSALDTAKA